jgi:hypothetical protein
VEKDYWRVDYRGNNGWKIGLYYGDESALQKRIKTLKYDKIEIKKLSTDEVQFIKKMNGREAFKVL